MSLLLLPLIATRYFNDGVNIAYNHQSGFRKSPELPLRDPPLDQSARPFEPPYVILRRITPSHVSDSTA
jgi:hypothetical protein